MTSSLLDYQAIAGLFAYDPISASFLVLIIGITAVAVCVAAYLGACAACSLLKKKRRERVREVSFGRHRRN
jgi:hypothetical protein